MHTTTKRTQALGRHLSNYRQDPRMGFEERRKEKYVGAKKFMEKIKEIQEETKAVLEKM